jgi:hypothetical protein
LLTGSIASPTVRQNVPLPRPRGVSFKRHRPHSETPRASRIPPCLGVNETRSAHWLDGEGNGHSCRTRTTRLNWKYERLLSAFVLYMLLLGTILASEMFLTGNSAFYFCLIR